MWFCWHKNSHELKIAELSNSFDFFRFFNRVIQLEEIFGGLRFKVGSALTLGWIAQVFIHVSLLKPPGTELAQILWEIDSVTYELFAFFYGSQNTLYCSELPNA